MDFIVVFDVLLALWLIVTQVRAIGSLKEANRIKLEALRELGNANKCKATYKRMIEDVHSVDG